MGFHRGPKIVTNGLVLYLDAANKKSYPGTGTVWTDLSGGNNTGTLTNGPIFSSNNGGSIVFDGINDYCICANTLNLNNSVTIEAWIYPTSYPIGEGGFILSNLGYYLEYNVDGKLKSYFYGLSTPGYHNSNSTVPLNAWSYVNTIRDKDNNTILFYINGILDKTITNITGNIFNGSSGGKPQIGGYSGSSYKFNGRISHTKLYNRALSPAEVLQNYNATKSRFNL